MATLTLKLKNPISIPSTTTLFPKNKNIKTFIPQKRQNVQKTNPLKKNNLLHKKFIPFAPNASFIPPANPSSKKRFLKRANRFKQCKKFIHFPKSLPQNLKLSLLYPAKYYNKPERDLAYSFRKAYGPTTAATVLNPHYLKFRINTKNNSICFRIRNSHAKKLLLNADSKSLLSKFSHVKFIPMLYFLDPNSKFFNPNAKQPKKPLPPTPPKRTITKKQVKIIQNYIKSKNINPKLAPLTFKKAKAKFLHQNLINDKIALNINVQNILHQDNIEKSKKSLLKLKLKSLNPSHSQSPKPINPK